MKKIVLFALAMSVSAVSASAETLIYGGIGEAESGDSVTNSDMPWSIGAIALKDQGVSFGFDIAGEGTVLDSTYGLDDEPNQAFSLNLIVAGNLYKTGSSRLDAGLLVGLRESTKDCPDSFLGYACYADQTPSVDYEPNYGGLVTYSFDRFTVGIRATGESTQLVVGTSF